MMMINYEKIDALTERIDHHIERLKKKLSYFFSYNMRIPQTKLLALSLNP